MLLNDLLKAADVLESAGDCSANVSSLEFDSRRVTPGALFFATRGTQADGHAFIEAAVGAGAVAVVCETMPARLAEGVAYLRVADSSVALGRMASAFYGDPSRSLRLVGVTGTNGKTTTATLLYRLFRSLGYKVGLISTVTYCIDSDRRESTHTTPDSVRLNRMMAEMVDRGCEYCFMEVSSHSLVQHRTEGLHFAGAVFTNITHDHLDYHHTFAEYIRAKKMLFDALGKEAFALTNADDRNGAVMVQNTKASVRTYGFRTMADFRCRVVEMLLDGMQLDLDGREVWVKFLGRFNAYNLTAVYATALLLGADRDEVLRTLSGLGPVDGRFESIRSHDGVTAIVDYAHTPDALINVLNALRGAGFKRIVTVFGCGGNRDRAKRPLMGEAVARLSDVAVLTSDTLQNVIDTIDEIRGKDRKLYVVVGCGGNRDRTKRPEMARIAADGADLAVLTSDNPRKEEPEAILAEMKAGLDASSRYLCIADRREAIKAAVALARPGDIVLVAGKGHETYQDVGGVKHHFDDREEVRRAMGLE